MRLLTTQKQPEPAALSRNDGATPQDRIAELTGPVGAPGGVARIFNDRGTPWRLALGIELMVITGGAYVPALVLQVLHEVVYARRQRRFATSVARGTNKLNQHELNRQKNVAKHSGDGPSEKEALLVGRPSNIQALGAGWEALSLRQKIFAIHPDSWLHSEQVHRGFRVVSGLLGAISAIQFASTNPLYHERVCAYIEGLFGQEPEEICLESYKLIQTVTDNQVFRFVGDPAAEVVRSTSEFVSSVIPGMGAEVNSPANGITISALNRPLVNTQNQRFTQRDLGLFGEIPQGTEFQASSRTIDPEYEDYYQAGVHGYTVERYVVPFQGTFLPLSDASVVVDTDTLRGAEAVKNVLDSSTNYSLVSLHPQGDVISIDNRSYLTLISEIPLPAELKVLLPPHISTIWDQSAEVIRSDSHTLLVPVFPLSGKEVPEQATSRSVTIPVYVEASGSTVMVAGLFSDPAAFVENWQGSRSYTVTRQGMLYSFDSTETAQDFVNY